ncbi:MAG: hypothetical protein NZ954_09040, partial [Thermofilaceae archaeon]|nr:hypothetical protein [Thermofilaceae archaeon]
TPSVFNGTHFIDLSGSGNHGRSYNVLRLPATTPWIWRVTGGCSSNRVCVIAPPNVEVYVAGQRVNVQPNTVTQVSVSGPVTVEYRWDKRAIGSTITYVLDTPTPNYAASLYVTIYPGAASVAPKIPYPNATLSVRHPYTNTILNIVYRPGTGPYIVKVNGTEIPSVVIPLTSGGRLNVEVTQKPAVFKAALLSKENATLL